MAHSHRGRAGHESSARAQAGKSQEAEAMSRVLPVELGTTCPISDQPVHCPGCRCFETQVHQPIQRCPVCWGSGHVPGGFYSGLPSTAMHETCCACGGVGILR